MHPTEDADVDRSAQSETLEFDRIGEPGSRHARRSRTIHVFIDILVADGQT
jgi:hypothetical protein